jgi:hypothetical protein
MAQLHETGKPGERAGVSPLIRRRLRELTSARSPKSLALDFPDESAISAWRLRIFPGKPSVSDDFLSK